MSREVGGPTSQVSNISVCQDDRVFDSTQLLNIFSATAHDAYAANALGVCVPDGPLTISALMAARAAGFPIALVPYGVSRPRVLELACEIGCSRLLLGSFEPKRSPRFDVQVLPRTATKAYPPKGYCNPSLLVLTSGTEGKPKMVWHSWLSLAESVLVRPELRSARWMALHPLTGFAGLNTALHAIMNQSTLIVPSALSARVVEDHIVRWKPTHISGTPTLWKNLLMSLPKGLSSLRDIQNLSLGGEIADQSVLSALRSFLPSARITHIYATTEAGICFSVSDGRAGFPRSWLENPDRKVELRVKDSQLLVRRRGETSSAILERANDGWWPTGDLVRLEGDRVHFVGRQSEVVSVGGAKVSPVEVEACLAEIPGIHAARVFGRKSSLAGSVLVAQLVLAPQSDQELSRRQALQHCRSRLPAFAVPRIIEFVANLEASPSGKLLRREA